MIKSGKNLRINRKENTYIYVNPFSSNLRNSISAVFIVMYVNHHGLFICRLKVWHRKPVVCARRPTCMCSAMPLRRSSQLPQSPLLYPWPSSSMWCWRSWILSLHTAKSYRSEIVISPEGSWRLRRILEYYNCIHSPVADIGLSINKGYTPY